MARSKPAFGMSDLMPSRPLPKQSITTTVDIGKSIKLASKGVDVGEISGKFERAINRASQLIATDLKKALDEAMNSPVWGGTDLIDTGELMASGRVTLSGNGITISYDAPYATLIHYGGYIHPYGNVNLRVFLPPRPWIESVMFGGGPVPQFDFVSYYTKAIASEFNR